MKLADPPAKGEYGFPQPRNDRRDGNKHSIASAVPTVRQSYTAPTVKRLDHVMAGLTIDQISTARKSQNLIMIRARNCATDSHQRSTPMLRIARALIREIAFLPLPIILLVSALSATVFVVATQWERLDIKTQWNLFGTQRRSAEPVKSPVKGKKPEQRNFDFTITNVPSDETSNAELKAALVKRLGHIVIEDANVASDGTIIGEKQKVSLYGIKQFNRKTTCTRASGERWACGLQAYAALRNTIEHKTITCEPKAIIDGIVSSKCQVERMDLALMLIRRGLAELEKDVTDPEMLSVQAAAKNQKLGVWDR